MSLMSFICFIIPTPLAPVLSARSRQWSTGALAVLLSRTESRGQTGPRAAAGDRDAAGRGRLPPRSQRISVWIDGLLVGYLPRDLASTLRPGLLAAQEREGKPIALEGVIVKGAMRGDGGSRLSVVPRYDPEDFGLSASPEVKHADSRPRTGLPVTTFSDPFLCKWGRDCTFCSNPITEGSLMVGLSGGGCAFAGPRTKFRGCCHPECVPLPEVMDRLDFTLMTSAARARTARRMSEAEIKSIVDRLADIAQVLIDADPEVKAEVFGQLGLKLTYRPGRKLVEANVQLAQFGFFDGVRGPTRPLRTRSTSR